MNESHAFSQCFHIDAWSVAEIWANSTDAFENEPLIVFGRSHHHPQ